MKIYCVCCYRKAVSVEAYHSLTLRNIFVETIRNDSIWQLNLRMYCETTDVAVFYQGTWTIRILNTDGALVHEMIADTIISGNQEREANTSFQLAIPADQVNICTIIAIIHLLT